MFFTVNPATGAKIKDYHYATWDDAKKAIEQAHQDFLAWRRAGWEERSVVIKKLATVLRSSKLELARLMQAEMGKSLIEAEAEVEKCALTCEYYANEAKGMLKSQMVSSSPYSHAEISFQPLGVIFSIMPWNFPVWQVLRFAAPALMAGNVIVLKHSDLTAETARYLGKIFNELTENNTLLRNVHVSHEVASRIIAHPFVQGVTFTGSTKGGQAVAVEAAKNLKKIVLELGGSDPYLVFADADLDRAAELCAKVRLLNCGQSCVAGKRFIVVEKVAELFVEKLKEKMQAATLAPLAHKKFQCTIIEQVEKLRSWGGEIVLGGQAPEGEGAFYPATIVVFKGNVPGLNTEEIFGPVATVIVVQNEQEALSVANSSVYGLGGGIFTSDIRRGKDLAERDLQAGFVVVNDFVKSDPRIPFGGIKQSGYGRELSHFGILEFVNIKTVAVSGDLS